MWAGNSLNKSSAFCESGECGYSLSTFSANNIGCFTQDPHPYLRASRAAINILPERKICRRFVLSTLLAPIVRGLQIIETKASTHHNFYVMRTFIISLLYRVQIYILKVSRKKRKQSKVLRRRSENIFKNILHSYYLAVCESGSTSSGQCLMTGFCEQNYGFRKCRIIL